MCRATIMPLPLWLPVVHLPVVLAIHLRGNFGSGYLQADVTIYAGVPNNHQKSLPNH
jgi:hypothetical protein